MGYEKIKDRLLELKIETEKLLKSNYEAGKDNMYSILSELRMIIRRIYPDHKEVEKSLIEDGYFYWDTSDEIERATLQEWFIRDVKTFIRTINTILKEEEIFNLKDFTPLKEKTETTLGLGKNTWGFLRKKTKEK